jgi:hypothetical protein
VTPLDTHVVICGFPRSGSTLLQVITATCFRDVHTAEREMAAHTAAQGPVPARRYLVSKRPLDVFEVDVLREHYRDRDASLKFVITERDPRDVLTSIHADSGNNGRYYVSTARWLETYRQVERLRAGADTLVLRFEDLIQRPRDAQDRLARFVGWTLRHPLVSFHEHAPRRLEAPALNGLRPLDASTIGRWRQARHAERIHGVIRELPELPGILVEMGYEPDEAWMDVHSVPMPPLVE